MTTIYTQDYSLPRNPFDPALVAWEAHARANLAAILKDAPPQKPIPQLAGWRCPGTAVAMTILGLRDPEQYAGLLIGRGPVVSDRVGKLIKSLLLSEGFTRWGYAHGMSTDGESLADNAVDRVKALFRHAGAL